MKSSSDAETILRKQKKTKARKKIILNEGLGVFSIELNEREDNKRRDKSTQEIARS